ncbi:MAG: hypothetical protein IT374_27060 [Polyangiaceae bacterium]|nr:hypothetical protein [Polyangiaceae bacterium]
MTTVCGLPGPARRCAHIAGRLAAGSSVVALTGAYIDPVEVRDAVLGAASLRHHIPVPSAAVGVAPPRALSDALGADVSMLLAGGADELPASHVVYVDVDRGVGDPSSWYQTLERYSAAAHAARSVGRDPWPAVLLCWPGDGVATPRPDVLLEIEHLHRAVHEIDARCMVRARCGDTEDAVSRWREHVLPALAGGDLALMDRLWDACVLGVEEVAKRCVALAAERGWQPGDQQAPDAELRGIVSRRGGEEEQHLAFATIARGVAPVERRLWRGLTGLLLPFLDDVRLALCERYEHDFGAGWAVRWPPSSEEELTLVRESHLQCQLGHLEAVAREAGRTGRHPGLPRLSKVAQRARIMRNSLAHYRPVAFTDYRNLLTEIERAGLRVSAR